MSSTSLPDHKSSTPLQHLRQLMVTHFSLTELQTLCFDLHVNYDELPHPGLTPKIRDLIQVMVQNGRLPDLHTAVSQVRPRVNWPSVDDLLADTLAFPPPAPQAIVSAQGEGATAVAPRGVNIQNSTIYGDIITGDTYNYYFEGTRFYLPEFTTAVKNFLYNYLGDEKNPVPFGGRDNALAQLEQWRIQADATPRLLLTAPAGRGKSALLVRWSAALQSQLDVAVVFMPISIRFSTNQENDTFSLLATRLAHLYGKQIPERWGNFPASTWRRLVAEYLQEPLPDGRSLLLIIDGLDEAAWEPGADLFPLQLPERVRLVVSARYRGGEEAGPAPWLRRLGWDRFPQLVVTMELQALTQAGVKDVLERMGCPLDELGLNVDLVTELYRLSEGDPLLVELYVKELWQRGEMAARLQPEDLQRIQPGYKGYFARWWAEQEKLWGNDDPLSKTLVSTLLDVLAMALGPLLLTDVRQLLTTPFSSRELRRAIRSLHRFVVGDGGEQGIVFAHPKLGEYFRDELDVDEQVTWQARFLAWGERMMDQLHAQMVQPRDVSRYLMLHYGRHLETSNADIEDLLPLVSKEWMQVWHQKTGMYSGFLQDVHWVGTRLQVINELAAQYSQEAPYIGQEILCALCHVSVHSLADRIPNDLLASLLQCGLWTEEQVIVYVQQKTDAEKRIGAFSSLLPYISDKKRIGVEREILATAQKIRQEKRRAVALVTIAPYLPQDTLVLAQEIDNNEDRAEVLAAVASHLSPEMQSMVLGEVLAATKEIHDKWRFAEVLAPVISLLPEEIRDDALAALHEALTLKWGEYDLFTEIHEARVRAIAPYLPQVALGAAKCIGDSWERTKVMAMIIPYLPEEARPIVLEEVLAVVRKPQASYEEEQVEVLVKLLPYMTPEMRSILLGEALTVMYQASRGERSARVLAIIAPYLSREACLAMLEEALIVAQVIHDESEQACVLTAIAPHLPQEVLVAVQEIENEVYRAEVLADLARYLPQEVLEASLTIGYEGYRTNVLVALTPFLPKEVLRITQKSVSVVYPRLLSAIASHFPQAMLVAASKIVNEQDRASVLEDIAPHLSKEVFAEAWKISDEGSRVRVLVAVAPYLPQEVLAIVQEMDGYGSRTRLLKVVATYLPKETLEVLPAIGDYDCNKVLIAIAPHLPRETLVAAQRISEMPNSEVLAAVAVYLPKEALLEASKLSFERDRVEVLASVALHLPQEVYVEAMAIGTEYLRTLLLKKVAPFMPQEVLAAAREISDEPGRADLLISLAPYLPQAVITLAQEMSDESNQSNVLKAVAPYLPQEVAAVAREIGNDIYRADVLARAVLHLPQDMFLSTLAEALSAAMKIDSELRREYVFKSLLDSLLCLSRSQLNRLWQEMLSLLIQRTRPSLLSDLAVLIPVIHRLGGKKGVRDTLDAVQKVTIWWP